MAASACGDCTRTRRASNRQRQLPRLVNGRKDQAVFRTSWSSAALEKPGTDDSSRMSSALLVRRGSDAETAEGDGAKPSPLPLSPPPPPFVFFSLLLSLLVSSFEAFPLASDAPPSARPPPSNAFSSTSKSRAIFRCAPTTRPSPGVRTGVGAAGSAADCTPSALSSRPPVPALPQKETASPARSPCFARRSRLLSAMKARRSCCRLRGSLSRMNHHPHDVISGIRVRWLFAPRQKKARHVVRICARRTYTIPMCV